MYLDKLRENITVARHGVCACHASPSGQCSLHRLVQVAASSSFVVVRRPAPQHTPHSLASATWPSPVHRMSRNLLPAARAVRSLSHLSRCNMLSMLFAWAPTASCLVRLSPRSSAVSLSDPVPHDHTPVPHPHAQLSLPKPSLVIRPGCAAP